MDKVDITMTSVLRPAILNQSLSTIVKNVVDNQDRFRLVINIDPIGEKVDPMKMVKVAKSHFNTVVYNAQLYSQLSKVGIKSGDFFIDIFTWTYCIIFVKF